MVQYAIPIFLKRTLFLKQMLIYAMLLEMPVSRTILFDLHFLTRFSLQKLSCYYHLLHTAVKAISVPISLLPFLKYPVVSQSKWVGRNGL